MDASQQVDYLINLLGAGGAKFIKGGKSWHGVLQWVQRIDKLNPGKKRALLDAVCKAFDTTETELYAAVAQLDLEGGKNGHSNTKGQLHIPERELEELLPKSGWIADYISYTRFTEACLSYHLFSSLCVLGAALGSRVCKPKGLVTPIWPAYRTLLVGPPALAKTSAANIAKGFIKRTGLCPIFADKITPEAIGDALEQEGPHQFIHAPELAVFLGRQRYNEGIVVLINRLLDDDEGFKIRRRHDEQIIPGQLAISFLGATTPSLLASATPEQTSSGGFLSRFVVVTEQSTEREFWDPLEGPFAARARLESVLERMKTLEGAVSYTPEADAFGKAWYHARKVFLAQCEDDVQVEVGSRLHVYLERTAILLHLADHGDLVVCEDCMRTSSVLMNYISKTLPQTSNTLRQSVNSQNTDFVLDQLKRVQGVADHSKLLRMCASRGILAGDFKQHIQTLKERGMIREETRGALRFYILEEG